jgi:hypothetical protein
MHRLVYRRQDRGEVHARPIIDLSETAGAPLAKALESGRKEKRMGANREMMKGDVGSKTHLVTPFDIRAAVVAEHADGQRELRGKGGAG